MGAGVVDRGGSGGKRRRSHARHKPMAEINVTPFVDVMLVLLIIFMVAAPLLTVGVPIELPETRASALPSETEEPLSLIMTADGLILLNNTEIAFDDLNSKLRAIAAEREDDKVFLRADASVSYGEVAKVMGQLQQGGFVKIGLVTDAENPSGN